MDSLAKIRLEAGSKWFDWKWQFSNRIRTLQDLSSVIDLTSAEIEAFEKSEQVFRFASTPYYLNLIDKNNPDCPVRKQIIPSLHEFVQRGTECEDPLAEEEFTVENGMIHRFHDRVLWYLSYQCGAYCRFCTRKRKVNDSSSRPGIPERERGLEYLRQNTNIREVILSGGDPLSLSDGFLKEIIAKIKSIPHINHIRIHTRIPVVMPMRITDELCQTFAEHFPVYIVTHFNHPNELTPEATAALKMLASKGNCILLNQNVLLSGINDTAETLRELYYNLTAAGVRPYYLHHCDEVYGISAFRVPYQKGIAIIKELKNTMSGISVPEFVVDLAGAGGKVPLHSYMTDL